MNIKRLLPLIVAVSIIIGVVIGFFYSAGDSAHPNVMGKSSNKIDALLNIIDNQYVDTADIPQIVEDALP